MVDRAKVLETVQIGLETTEGTAVVAPTNIRSVSIETKIGGAAELFRPDGRKFNVLGTLNQEWSMFTVNGKATYTEICYILPWMFGNPAPVTPGGATLARQRTYEIADTTVLSPKTATIMKGNAVRAQKIAGSLLTDFTMAFSRKSGITLTGSGIGRLFTDGITLTASPSDIALIPMVGKELDIYIDSTAAGLGTTKLTRAFSHEIALTGVFGPVWAIDSSQSSFSAHVDLGLSTGVKFKVEADATGMAYLTQFRANTLMFVRIEGTSGTLIELTTPNLLTYDVCLLIKTVDPDTDEDGVTTVEFDCELVRDSTWGKAMSLVVQNGIATVA